jgi:hypothetical protein
MAGADGVERLPTIPADLAELETVVRETSAVLIVVDPLVAYLGAETNAHRDQDVRRALAPLAALADRTGAAVLGIRHLNKAAGGPSIYRGGGSIAIGGAARAVHVVGRDPDNAAARIMAPVKSNLGPEPKSMRYMLESQGTVARVQWLGTCDVAADALLAQAKPGDRDKSALEAARSFLEAELAEGPRPSKTLLENAEREGIPRRTLWRAKDVLGVTASKTAFDGGWAWTLPLNPEECQTPTVGTLREKNADGTPKNTMISAKSAKSAKSANVEECQTTLAPFGGGLSDDDEERL